MPPILNVLKNVHATNQIVLSFRRVILVSTEFYFCPASLDHCIGFLEFRKAAAERLYALETALRERLGQYGQQDAATATHLQDLRGPREGVDLSLYVGRAELGFRYPCGGLGKV